jgi:hypothetical protein
VNQFLIDAGDDITNNKYETWYLRDKQRRKIGVILLVFRHNNVSIGWSRCCRLDRFDRERGENIAFNRAKIGWGPNVKIPRDVDQLVKHIVRKLQSRKTSYSVFVNGEEKLSTTQKLFGVID